MTSIIRSAEQVTTNNRRTVERDWPWKTLLSDHFIICPSITSHLVLRDTQVLLRPQLELFLLFLFCLFLFCFWFLQLKKFKTKNLPWLSASRWKVHICRVYRFCCTHWVDLFMNFVFVLFCIMYVHVCVFLWMTCSFFSIFPEESFNAFCFGYLSNLLKKWRF